MNTLIKIILYLEGTITITTSSESTVEHALITHTGEYFITHDGEVIVTE